MIALRQSYLEIIQIYLKQGYLWDSIYPLPSSFGLTTLFAKKVCEDTGIGTCFNKALRKVSAGHIIKNIKTIQTSSANRSNIHQDVKRFIQRYGEEADFQMKYIKNVRLRQYINPFERGLLPINVPPKRVLLIDDMVTSGASLIHATKIIRSSYPTVQIEALTLFGSSK